MTERSEGRGGAAIGRPGSYAKGHARRQEILDRAIEVFAELGSEGASLRRIAESIGVSHAALLHYFDSREQLLVAVYEHAEAARIRGSRAEEVETALDILLRSAIENATVPGLVQLYSTLVATSVRAEAGESRRYFTERFAHVRREIADRLRADQAAGRVRDDVDAEDLASVLIASSDGLQIQWLLDPDVGIERTLRVFSALLRP